MNDDDALSAAEFIRTVLRGVGQVMFQNHALTGLCFLLGILVASPLMALGGLLGAILGTLTAQFLRYDRQEIRDGLYGFNSALVGVALLFYDRPGAMTFALIAVGSIGAAAVTRAMRRYAPFPTYTAPFIVTTWALLAMAAPMGVFTGPPAGDSAPSSILVGITEGVSEVMLQANPLTGALFLAGIAISAWPHALWALAASTFGLFIATWHHDPAASISIGIYGYNAALAAMALWLYRPSLVFPLAAAAISVPITEGFPSLGLETLTAPFVLASWLTILLARLDELTRAGRDAG